METIENKETITQNTNNSSTSSSSNLNTSSSNNKSEVNNKYLQELKELKDNINQLKAENKELLEYKYNTETNLEKQKLYQKYSFSEQDQQSCDKFLAKYQIKNYQEYIKEFNDYLLTRDDKTQDYLNSSLPKDTFDSDKYIYVQNQIKKELGQTPNKRGNV